jgi:hypothetical protein
MKNHALEIVLQRVVTPNMVRPIAGLPPARRAGSRSAPVAPRAFTMPTMAAAPLASICRDTEFSPATSVTE